MYKKDKLKEYIDFSILKVINDSFHIRLSSILAKKFDNGDYDIIINKVSKYIEEIKNLNIIYPSNSNPVFYMYIVPDENFIELLNYPFTNKSGGGKIVMCYDIDGFTSAHGISQNMCENIFNKNHTIDNEVNAMHELAHLVLNQFSNKDRFICEGFAESVPLFIMDYESKFDIHRNAITSLNESQIYTARELLEMEKNNAFDGNFLIPNKSCSFDLAYISSYLFVRGCLELISLKFNLNKNETIQKFLEIVRNSKCTNVWFILDLANELNISPIELLDGKSLQIDTLKNLNYNIKKR